MLSPAALARTSAFQFRDFRLFTLGRLMATLAMQMQGVAVGWQVYALTGSALDLGYVGLVQFLPALLLAPITGHVADRFDRKRIMMLAQATLALGSALLLTMTLSGAPSKLAIYAVLALVGTARAFVQPTGSALMPNLIPAEQLPSAVAWGSSTFQLAIIVGPALGGLLYSAGDATRVYGIALVAHLTTLAMLVPVRPRARDQAPPKRDLVAGLRFVFAQPVILGAISLDLFAVLFGGAVALMPAFARDVLHTGPEGMGLLRSAPAVGALTVGLVLANRPLRRHAGRTMYACVALFGLATVAFGLSRNFTLSLCALAITGAADMVSVFVRQSLVQLRTPDAMRGRVSAVNSVFIGASNELGEFESGLTAAWLGLTPAVIAGGVGTIVIVALWTVLFPALREVDRLDARA
ncbi:MAG: MFS transporter [Polyangiales bacterium]